MSKTTVIGVNGDANWTDTVDKLRANELGAGTTDWVPEDETRAEALHVTANGSYEAASAGKYGNDYVTVSVPGTSVSGRDPDTGEDVVVTVDPETGDIVETVIPYEIRVTTPPTKTSYQDGETIDYTGIVVHAYSATGVEMLTVPNGEITLYPTTAAYDASTYSHTATSDLDNSPLPQTLPLSTEAEYLYYRLANPEVVLRHTTNADPYTILTAARNSEKGYVVIRASETPVNNASQYTYNGKTVYYTSGSFSANDTQFVSLSPDSGAGSVIVNPFANIAHAAWTMIYGEIMDGSMQTITVSWPRPGDGAILETSFDIVVSQSSGYGGAEGGGGQAGDTGAGRD